MPAESTGLPRLRPLRVDAGWTQQELAEKLIYLAWTHGDSNVGVNADMVAKWERGVKGISARYRLLLCELFGVTPAELGVAPPSAPATRTDTANAARDPESLVGLLDQATGLLTQLGAAGNALAPQLLSAFKDTAATRRTMLGLLDPAGHAHAVTATLADLEQLTDRYYALYATADPAALLTALIAHVKLAHQALHRDNTATQRRALLRNLARAATLAGRLTFEDLGDALQGRAYYALALEAAREADDHHTAAIAAGHMAQLAHTEGHTTAALDHLTAGATSTTGAPALTSWLAGIEAIIHADRGDHAAAHDALNRAQPNPTHPRDTPFRALPEHTAAHAAATGHVQLQAGNYTAARDTLTQALHQLPATARRARVLLLLDLATTELHTGDLATACRHATTAATLLNRTPYATGTNYLRAFRNAAANHAEPKILRILDEQLARTAA